jgi:hypothetical protein
LLSYVVVKIYQFSPICVAGTDYALARARSTDQRTR